MKTFYEIKNVFASDFEGKGMIADVDMKSRTVTGYFSRFGNVDSDGDVLMPGAFTKSISERGAGSKNIIPHILDHDIHVTLKQLSKPKLYEKSDGGFFESTISDTTNGIDTLKLYRDGVINQHSFGFRTLQKEDKGKHREIKEVMLYEISTVTLGANSETPFTGFKSFTQPELVSRYKTLTKAFDGGDYTDETFQILEAQIKQLEREIISKATEPESFEKSTNELIASFDKLKQSTQPEYDENLILTQILLTKQLITK
jgi:HK97 family phage prohead protease